MRIVPVDTAAQLEQVRALFEEYWNSFGFTPCFQNFATELAGLPARIYRRGVPGSCADRRGSPRDAAALKPFDGEPV